MHKGRLLLLLLLAVPFQSPAAEPVTAHVEVAFTPGDDVSGLIVQRIGAARQQVQMQAYLFTDRRIANALVAACRRGVAVELIADPAQEQTGGSPFLPALARAGARIYLATSAGAAHNKILIVDGAEPAAAVVTGSYNFTRSAAERNAENVVVLSGNRAVTDRFVANFHSQRGLATPWTAPSTSPR